MYMKRIKFRCPECHEKVIIEGANKKVCPYCGWKETYVPKVRRRWLINPFTKVRENKRKWLHKREDIENQLEDMEG